MKSLLGAIRKHPACRGISRAIRSGRNVVLTGLRGSALSAVAACLSEDIGHTVAIITSSTENAEAILDDLETFGIDPLLEFPVGDIFSSGAEAILDEDTHRRMLTLCSLSDDDDSPAVVVTPIQAVIQPVPTPSSVTSASVQVVAGRDLDREKFLSDLVDAGLEHVPMVEMPGEFSARGGILDVFPLSSDRPLRIELVGNTVESIRVFDVVSQESVSMLDAAAVNMSAPRVGEDSMVLDHLPDGAVVVLDEPSVLQVSAETFSRSAGKTKLFSFADVLRALERVTTVSVTPLPEKGGEDVFEMNCHAVPAMEADLDKVAARLSEVAGTYRECVLLCDTDSEVDRFRELFKGRKLPKRLSLRAGRLQQGFTMPEIDLCVLTSHEMFNRYRRPRRLSAPKETAALDEIAGIEEGDHVVHVAHGIGRFEGLKLLEDEGGSSEFLVLRYADEARVYIPASQMLMVQKYVGGVRRRPKLSRIKGADWARKKEAARVAARGLASRLLRTQAVRVARKRTPYPVDDAWQMEFEASFRFTETDDQLRVLGEIKSDMTGAAPLDRLVCGDVGYGKTEIAMRAAFKAATAGRQVALLAPTTILVQQHYRTFRERMADYPLHIEELSRFRTDAEQKAVIESLTDGRTDIVIGTHRLLQKDVTFEKLGLLIIDEEQRFGVEQKEFLKRLRRSVDVLTLTATPIPRTLHLSLLGLRDISALKTPPLDRHAIETRIIRYDKNIIRQGILRELNRNGQVYFIHNRVHNIETVANRVEEIVPEARIGIGHGQMSPRELEATMTSFLNGELDVFVATTIVESGLDIPSVNTIFVNRADDFGLADLHQLRGRVGRYRHHAYAYFILPEHGRVTPKAEKRLRAIEDFAYLGAGFDIAMRDLEIRGAGNILGREQHGHIAAIGYGLYCRLLERAVAVMRGGEVEPLEWVDLRLGLDAYVPAKYVKDERQRLDLYKRLAVARNEEDLERVSRSMLDRFGRHPTVVKTLLEEHALRVRVAKAGVESLVRVGEFVEVTLREKRPEVVEALLKADFRQLDSRRLALPVGSEKPSTLLKRLSKTISDISIT